jgi:peptidoglycan/LPS O-acetylase OafA/YrhL
LNRIRRAAKGLLFGSSHDLPELDGLRALAVLMVLTYHVWVLSYLDSNFHLIMLGQDLTFIFAWGHPGVDLFFILSGFLLFLPFARAFHTKGKSPNLKGYFIKRLFRILPAYYLFLFASIFIIYPQQYLASQALPQIAANMFFMQTFMFSTPVYPAIIGVTWTLVIEMQFYFVLPIVAYFFLGKRGYVSLPVVLAIVFIYRFVMLSYWNANPTSADFNYFYASEYNLLGVFDNFAIGMVLANFYQSNLINGMTERGRKFIDACKKLIWVVPILLLFSLSQYFLWRFDSHQEFAWYFFSFFLDITVYTCFAIVMVYVIYHQSRLRNLLRLRYLGIIGVVSYSVYLVHLTVVNQLSGTILFSSLHGWDRYFLLMPMTLLISLAIAVVVYLLVEKPFIDKSHAWSAKLKK